MLKDFTQKIVVLYFWFRWEVLFRRRACYLRLVSKTDRLKQRLIIFPSPPMVAFKQHPNLQRQLCHAKLPGNNDHRTLPGMKKCLACSICSYIKVTKECKSNKTGEIVEMTGAFTCKTKGVVYMTSCLKCGIQYIGQTTKKFNERLKQHVYNIKNGKEANGIHFTSRGHSLDDFRAQILEKVMPSTTAYLLQREEYWINKFQTKTPNGLNIRD